MGTCGVLHKELVIWLRPSAHDLRPWNLWDRDHKALNRAALGRVGRVNGFERRSTIAAGSQFFTMLAFWSIQGCPFGLK